MASEPAIRHSPSSSMPSLPSLYQAVWLDKLRKLHSCYFTPGSMALLRPFKPHGRIPSWLPALSLVLTLSLLCDPVSDSSRHELHWPVLLYCLHLFGCHPNQGKSDTVI